MTSCAPRLAERNARPVTQAGMERPERKKSRAALHIALQGEADAEDEGKVDNEDRVIDRGEMDGGGHGG